MSRSRPKRPTKPTPPKVPSHTKEAPVYGPIPRKPRTRRCKDKPYTPHNYGEGCHGDRALNILTDASKTVVDKNGNKIPKKTSFQFASPTKKLLDEKAQKLLKDKIKTVPTHRPATAVAWFSNGVPRVLETPNKTRLNYRGGAQGIGYSYVNRSPLRVLKNPKIKDTFSGSTEEQAIVPNPSIVKEQQKLLTKDIIAKTKQEIRRNHGIRSMSQAAVMKNKDADRKDVSATKIANAAGIAEGVPKHFGHALGHHFLGAKSQNPLNLSIVTKHSNGAYLAQAEYVLSYLIDQVGKVLFTANAHCFKNGSHIQEKLEVVLEVPGAFTLTMTFDGQQLSPTDKSSKEYMLALAQTLVGQRIRKTQTSEDKDIAAKTQVSGSPDIFFSRKQNCKISTKSHSRKKLNLDQAASADNKADNKNTKRRSRR